MKKEKGKVPENNFSDEFKDFLRDEKLKTRAWAMVDAILEDNPNTNPQEIFEEALKWIKEHPEDFAGDNDGK